MTGQSLPLDWVDAFTDRPFGGNGCAVVHDGGALPPETCMAVVRETSLVECTFVGPSDVADVRVRYFLAGQEIPFAGHPTIATVASLVHRGLVSGDRITLETGAGLVPCTLGKGWITMTQAAPGFGPEVDPALVAAVVGLEASDIIEPPQVVSTGLPFCVAVVRDRATIRRARMNPEALAAFRAALAEAVPGALNSAMEPYLVTLEGASDAGSTFARLILAPPNPPEDPFTGSATGAAAAYLWSRGLLADPVYLAEQGHDMGRPGQARVEVLGPPDAITGVRVGGQAHVLMSGELRL